MKLTKNKFTMMAGTLLLTLALTACGSASDNEPTDDANSNVNVEETNNNEEGEPIELFKAEDAGVEVDDNGDELIKDED